jgi:hypothetical protein
MRELLMGAAAGAAATVPMSAVFAAGHATGRAGEPAPRKITGRAEAKAGVRDDLPEPAFEASWVAAHFAYGAACGALYAAARPWLPASPVAAGLVFGGVVWGASYLGLMPALGLYPWPREDRPARLATLIAGHVVYGLGTALAGDRLARRGADRYGARVAL